MRPLKIELQNFGPYEHTVIDFTEFGKQSLFLVAGNTGAGKTTIFDAMCYALFGKTTSEQRSATALRSDFAAPDQETKVTFTFAHQGQTYQVMRRPKQTLIGRRGRPVDHNQAVQLIYPLESDQPHEITKIKEADTFITNLLNLTRDQFRQIVLLPQGKFRQFLDSDSNTKEELLRDLFNTSVYEQWAQQLKDQLTERKRGLADQATKLQSVKENVTTVDAELGNDEWLAAVESQLADLRRKLTELNQQEAKQQTQVNQVTKQLHDEQDLQRWLTELADAQQTAKQLAEQKPVVTKQQAQLADLQWFQDHQVAYRQWQDSEQQLTNQQERITKLTAQLRDLDTRSQDSEQHYQELAAKQPTMEKLRDQARELSKKLPLFAELNRLQAQVKGDQQRLTAAQRQQNTDQKQAAKLNQQISAVTAQLTAHGDLAATQRTLDQQQRHYADLQQAQKALQDLQAAQQATTQQQSQLTAELKHQTVIVEQQTQQLADLNDADARYQIARLATRLKPGSPCPVCGALDHPHPAHVDDQAAMVTDEELQTANDRLQTSRDKQSRMTERAKQVQTQLVDLQNQVADAQTQLTQLLDSTELPNDWEEQITQYGQKLQAAVQDLQEQQTAATREQQILEKLKNQVADLEEPLKQDEAAVQQAQQELTKDQAILATRQAELPEAMGDEATVKKQVADLQKQFAEFTTQLQAADQERHTITQQRAVTENSLTTAKADHTALTKQQDERHEQLTKELQDYRADLGWEFWDRAQEQLPQLVKLQTAIRDFQTQVHDTEQQIQRLTDQVADRPAPDIAATQAELVKTQEKLSALQRTAGQYETQQKQLTTAQHKVVQMLKKNGQQEKELNAFQTLTDVVTGNTENHLSLERYVLQAYFQEVLAAANVQLDRLTNGRYQFELSNDRHGAGAKWSGLEVNVYDDNAGKTRSARTLSGGESFMASLALALALCQIIQEQSGGISIDALFVDEGFGSLDQTALADALRALQELEGHRMIGIISHVTELEEQIPDQLRVTSVNGRSKVSYQHDIQA